MTLSPMNPKLRADVRALLVATAGDTPGTDQPAPARTGWRRPAVRRTALVLASSAAIAGTTSVLLVADPAAPPSYASWNAVPVTAAGGNASDDDIVTWSSRCSDLGVGGVAVQGVPADRTAAAQRTILVDRRGDLLYCVDVSLGSATATDPLIALSGIRADHGPDRDLNQVWATVFDKPFTRPAADRVLLLGGDLQTPPAGDGESRSLRVYQLYGLAGAGVTGVDVVLPNGLRVTATVRDGVWGAWWPADKGDPTGCRLDVHTTAGTRTVDPATVRLPWD